MTRYKRTIFGGKKKKRSKYGLSKPKKNKQRRRKQTKKRKLVVPTITIKQPKKRRYTINVNRKKPRVRSMTFSDSSMFLSGTGMKPSFKRKTRIDERMDDMVRGISLIQDNDKFKLSKYPN